MEKLVKTTVWIGLGDIVGQDAEVEAVLREDGVTLLSVIIEISEIKLEVVEQLRHTSKLEIEKLIFEEFGRKRSLFDNSDYLYEQWRNNHEKD